MMDATNFQVGAIGLGCEIPQLDVLSEETGSLLSSTGAVYISEVPGGFDYVGFMERMGTSRAQYDGKHVWDLKPEPGMDAVYHSRNRAPLVPHTELYEQPGIPPKYLGLWCVREASDGGGATTLADGMEYVKGLPDDLTEELRRPSSWRSSEGLRKTGLGYKAREPILQAHAGQDLLRFSANNLLSDSEVVSNFVSGMVEHFEQSHVSVRMTQGSILLWDNHRMIHSRTAFSDRERHLRRMLLDPLR